MGIRPVEFADLYSRGRHSRQTTSKKLRRQTKQAGFIFTLPANT